MATARNSQIGVLFVCMGNICRSPTAEGVFRQLVEVAGLKQRFIIDSAGTHNYHTGASPDRRARETANARGIRLDELKARSIQPNDFRDFDFIIAMDNENLAALQAMAPSTDKNRIRLLLEFASDQTVTEVPDPYYGGDDGFEPVFDLIADGADGLLTEISAEYDLAQV